MKTLALALIVLLAFASVANAQGVKQLADEINALLTTVEALETQVTDLNAKLLLCQAPTPDPTPPPPPTTFKAGDRVGLVQDAPLLTAPGGTIKATLKTGTKGEILKTEPVTLNGVTYWPLYVGWASGWIDGSAIGVVTIEIPPPVVEPPPPAPSSMTITNPGERLSIEVR